jgi:hypothetical protein
MQDYENTAPTAPKARALEQGQADRGKAAAPAKARLVDPDQAAGRWSRLSSVALVPQGFAARAAQGAPGLRARPPHSSAKAVRPGLSPRRLINPPAAGHDIVEPKLCGGSAFQNIDYAFEGRLQRLTSL